ncbi:MAG: hypothetical protein ACQESE_03040 [Nanobdellota archaeon]
MAHSEEGNTPRKAEENDFERDSSLFVDNATDFDFIENDIYKAEFIDSMLDNDELSMDEAAFMRGYDDFN